MNIVFKDILPEHFAAAAHLAKSVLNQTEGHLDGPIASIFTNDKGQTYTLYLFAYTEGVLSLSYKETE